VRFPNRCWSLTGLLTLAVLAAGLNAAGCGAPALNPAPASPPTVARGHARPNSLDAGSQSAGASATPSRSAAAAPTPIAIAQATHEYPSPPVRQRARAPAPDPVSAVTAFAGAYINWDASTVAADMSGLAARSVGQARSALQLAAVQTAQDYELARAGVANRGSVEAIAPVAGHPGQYAVVTLERTTATDSTAYAGLGAAWHVAIATVVALAPGRWVVSGWQPEN
jgi:hypothetical protein